MSISRQNPSAPRFYIDYLQYLNTRGVGYDYRVWLWGCKHIKGRPRPDQLVINPNYLQEEDQSSVMQCWGINPLNHIELVNKEGEGNFEFSIARSFTNPIENGPQMDYKNWFLNSNYICLFGHNFGTAKLAFKVRFKTRIIDEDGGVTNTANYYGDAITTEMVGGEDFTSVINARTSQDENGYTWITPKNDGVTLVHFNGKIWDKLAQSNYAPVNLALLIASYDEANDQVVSIANHQPNISGRGNPRIASLSIGRYFDFPKGSNLDLKISREFDVNESVTAGGYSHREYKHRYSINPFEVFFPYDKDPILQTVYKDFTDEQIPQYQEYTWKKISNAYSRKGQRTWEMSFNYLDDSDLMPIHESSNTILFDTTDLTLDEHYSNFWASSPNIHPGGFEDHALAAVTPNHMYWADHGSNFYSMVINPTLGGQLPFIFHLNKNDRNPDKFCVAVFDQKEFTYERASFNSYNISLKIKETW